MQSVYEVCLCNIGKGTIFIWLMLKIRTRCFGYSRNINKNKVQGNILLQIRGRKVKGDHYVFESEAKKECGPCDHDYMIFITICVVNINFNINYVFKSDQKLK